MGDKGNGPVPGPRISWTMLLSTGTLILALVGGGWSLVRSQVDEVRREVEALKEFTGQGRGNIIREVDGLRAAVAELRTNKLEISRFDQVLSHLSSADEIRGRFAALDQRVDGLVKRLNATVNALDSTYNLLNEHLRGQHPHRTNGNR